MVSVLATAHSFWNNLQPVVFRGQSRLKRPAAGILNAESSLCRPSLCNPRQCYLFRTDFQFRSLAICQLVQAETNQTIKGLRESATRVIAADNFKLRSQKRGKIAMRSRPI